MLKNSERKVVSSLVIAIYMYVKLYLILYIVILAIKPFFTVQIKKD